jgi:hypothetical protein
MLNYLFGVLKKENSNSVNQNINIKLVRNFNIIGLIHVMFQYK